MPVFSPCLQTPGTLAAILFCLFIAPSAFAAGPDIQVPDASQNLGEVLEGSKPSADFPVHNQGDQPLLITKIGRSAGGIITHYPRKIDPSESGTISIQINTLNRPGDFPVNFFVYSNDQDQPRLQLQAKVKVLPLVSVSPDRIYFSGFDDNTYETTIDIENNRQKPLTISDFSCSPAEKLEHQLTTVVPNTRWQFRIALREPVAGTYFRGRCIASTDDKRKPEIIIPLLTRIMAEVEMMPPEIDFGLHQQNNYRKPQANSPAQVKEWQQNWNTLPKQLTLRVNRGDAVEVEEFVIDDPMYEVEFRTLQEGSLYLLTITPRIDKMQPGSHTTQLRLQTTSTAFPRFSVPIRITVK